MGTEHKNRREKEYFESKMYFAENLLSLYWWRSYGMDQTAGMDHCSNLIPQFLGRKAEEIRGSRLETDWLVTQAWPKAWAWEWEGWGWNLGCSQRGATELAGGSMLAAEEKRLPLQVLCLG